MRFIGEHVLLHCSLELLLNHTLMSTQTSKLLTKISLFLGLHCVIFVTKKFDTTQGLLVIGGT